MRAEHELAAIRDACSRGEPDACMTLADALDTGHYIAPDPSRSRAILDKLCDAGTGEACVRLANQIGLPDERRIELTHRACDLGELESCMSWANALSQREGAQLATNVFDTLTRRCQDGDTEACFTAKRIELRASAKVPNELWKAALDRELASCADEHPEACARAARLHAQAGAGPAAREDRLRACELGDGPTCMEQASLDPYGSESAEDLYRQACALSIGEACWNVAIRTKDPIESAVMYERGCDLDDVNACSTLATRLESRHDAADDARAHAIRNRMCRAGDADECISVAEEATKRRDPAVAIALYGRACDLGSVFYGCAGKAEAMHAECVRGHGATCSALDAFLAQFPAARRDFIAFDCCADRPNVGASPAAAFIRLKHAAGSKDPAAWRALIDPSSGLHIRSGWHAPDAEASDSFDVTVENVDPSRLPVVAQSGFNKVDCPDSFVDTEVTCTAFEGGFAGTYRFRQADGHVYVFDIDEESH